MRMEMSFPGGLRVDTEMKGFTVSTDQPVKVGGEGSAPAPFDLFLVSIGTCAGLYVLQFCERRGIDTGRLGVAMETTWDPESRRVTTIRIEVRLPADFPEKYIPAVRRAVDQCAVKRHMFEPPEFEIEATLEEPT